MIQWHRIKQMSELADQRDSELLILFDAARAMKGFSDLESQVYPSLTQQHEYLRILFGFRAPSGKKPYIIAEWLEEDRPVFEKRWLWTRAMNRLRSQLSFEQVHFFLNTDTAFDEQVALTEDFLQLYQSFSNTSPIEVKVSVADQDNKTAAASAWQQWVEDESLALRCKRGYIDWINQNPDDLTSLEIGRQLQQFAKEHGCWFEEFDRSRLKEEGLNLLLAVGQASASSPSRLFLLANQNPQSMQQAPLLLVGKGITFDTGGINVKPFESFVNAMKNDMGGAALTAHLFMYLVEKKIQRPLVLAIPSCENLVAEKSMKPGAVVRSHKGLEVMIEHTDAEGRLILADAISYAQQRFKPEHTLVAATLTTAALRQFSNYRTPIHFAPTDFAAVLAEKAKRYGEEFIFEGESLPYRLANRSKFGDLTNMGRLSSHAAIGGGSNVAAHFLKEFSEGPLMHLDIFASCWNWSGDYPGAQPGATGAPFRSLAAALYDWVAP